jgi:8-oxo-dGTP diphosphatase
VTLAPRATVVVLHHGCVALIERIRGGARYWVLPGGGVEDGETPADAARREAFEELGLIVQVVRHLADVHDPTPSPRPVAHVFLCSTEDPTFGPMTGPEVNRSSALNSYAPQWVPIERAALLVDGGAGDFLRRYLADGWWPSDVAGSGEA